MSLSQMIRLLSLIKLNEESTFEVTSDDSTYELVEAEAPKASDVEGKEAFE